MKRGKFKILGITILRVKELRGGSLYLLFGIPIFFTHCPFNSVRMDLLLNDSLDTKHLDRKILSIVNEIPTFMENSASVDGIVILASELYDSGGHTECIKNIVSGMPEQCKMTLLLTRKDWTLDNCMKAREIAKYSEICGVEYHGARWRKQLTQMFGNIVTLSPKAVVVFIHMDDVFGASLLAMLKKHTDIKILFFNHASHYPALGMSFCDLILEGTATTEAITKEQRGFDNTRVIGLPCLPESELPTFSADEIMAKRKQLGIPEGGICTMSGAASYKFFDNGRSPYFEMIKRLLQRNENLFHVVITDMSKNERGIVDIIFADSSKNRLIVIPASPDYRILFKCADVFIDSFPVSSALTQIDLISMRIPNVVKRNSENPLWDFSEYMPVNYRYAFEDVTDMEQGIEDLLQSAIERNKVADENYTYFLNNFEGVKWCKNLIDLIEECNG